MPGPLLIPLAAAGAQIAGSIFSFSQAKKARDKEKRAQAAAAKAMVQAKQELSVNYLKGLSIAKEPYELEREALLQAGASVLQAGVEGDQRGAGAVAGRVLMAQQQQQAQQRAAMSQEMAALKKLGAQEDARLGTARATVDLNEAAGARKAAQDAALMAQYNTQQGMQQAVKGVTGVITSGLFGGPKNKGESGFEGFEDFKFDNSTGFDISKFGGIDLSGVIANNDTIDYSKTSMFGQPIELN